MIDNEVASVLSISLGETRQPKDKKKCCNNGKKT